MHSSVLKLLPFTIHHAIKSIKSITAPAAGTGALFGCCGAITTAGGAQITGGGAGLWRAPAQFNPHLPILLYGLEVCPLNNNYDLRSLDFTVTRLLMKLFRTSNKDVINECCYYFNFKLPSEILPGRFDRFI